MSDIFLSYASQDRETARALAGALERHGWTVWWDRRIPTGRDYAEVIESELAAARSVVVLWSRASVASEWVKTEAADAKDRRRLVPVLIEPVKIPLEFRRTQAADLDGWKAGAAAHPGFETLVADLANFLGRPGLPPLPGADAHEAKARTDSSGGYGGVERTGLKGEQLPPARRPLLRQPFFLAGVVLGFLTLAAAGLWLVGAFGRNEGQSGDGKAAVVNLNASGTGGTQNSSPTPPPASPPPAANNVRPTPTPTPDAGSNRNDNLGTPGGDAGLTEKQLQEVKQLLEALNSPDGATREKALSTLCDKYDSNPHAAGEALGRLDERQLRPLSLDAINSIFLYLNKTEDSAWTPELLAGALRRFRGLDRVEMDGEGLTQYGIFKQRIQTLAAAKPTR